MPRGRIFEFRCPKCDALFEDFWLPGDALPLCPRPLCDGRSQRVYSRPIVIIPAHMSDSSMHSRTRQREWLKSDAAKKMDLEPYRDDDSDYADSDYVERHPDVLEPEPVQA